MTQSDASAPYSGSVVAAGTAGAVERPRRGLGIWSLVLALLAVMGGVVAAISVVTAAQTFETDINTGLQNLFGAVVFAVILMIGGFIAAIVGLILGIMAVSRHRGRVLGVAGMLISILVAFGWIIVIILAVAGGAGLTSIAEWV